MGLAVAVPPPEPEVGVGDAEADGWPGGAEPPPPAGLVCCGLADADADAVAEWLGEGEYDGWFVRDMPVPSEAFADWPPAADGDAAGRTVVPAPLASVGPLPVSSL